MQALSLLYRRNPVVVGIALDGHWSLSSVRSVVCAQPSAKRTPGVENMPTFGADPIASIAAAGFAFLGTVKVLSIPVVANRAASATV